jgi:cobalt-zinc-cadmium efflux system protein
MSHEHGAGHAHGAAPDANTRYLAIALALIVGFMIVEVTVAVFSGSLALLSDAGYMLTDAAAITGSLVAIRLAAKPSSARWTCGFKRAEILSAATNGISLVVISGIVSVEAIRRLITPPQVAGGPLLIVALVGVAVNLVAVWVLAKANRTSLNVEGSFQHILTDLYGFIATVIAGLIILFTGFTRADAIASLIVVVLMLRAAWGLLKDSGRILLEGTPEGIDLADIRAHLLEPAHVLDVHDLHVWTVTSDLPALSAHVTLTEECFHDGHAPRVLDELQACLVGHFDVEHSTFQLEPATHAAHETGTDHK